MRTKLRSKVTLLFVVCAALLAIPAMAMALTLDSSGNPLPAPTISSDKADYAPGELVTLTGSNWQPGESVNIKVNDDEGQTWNRNVDVTADDSGNITDSFNLPDWFVATYSVTASGASGTTTTSFTDGAVKVKTVGTGSTAATIDWRLYNNATCSGSFVSSGSISADTGGSGTGIPGVNIDDTQSLRLSAGAVSGYTFSSWSNGNFITSGGFSPTSNPGCLVGQSGTQNTQVNYTAAPTNTAPVASGQSVNTDEDTAQQITLSGSDSDGNSLSFQIVSSPTHGTLGTLGTPNCTGTVPKNCTATVTYTPTGNYNGPDSFTFKVNDGTVDSTAATVSITVAPIDDPPTAAADQATVLEDATATAINVLANDIDIDGGPKTISSASDPVHGTVVLTGGTTGAHTGLTYQPDADYCNDPPATNLDTFTYTLNGGSQATVSMKVTCVNDAPTKPGTPALANGSVTPNQGVFGLTWTASTDAENDTITYTLQHKDADDAGFSNVTGATNLSTNSYAFTTASKEAEGTWTYQVKASDGSVSSAFSDASSAVKVDQQAPSQPNANFSKTAEDTVGGWYKDSVTVSYNGSTDPALADTSAGSGVKEYTTAQPFNTTGTHNYSGTATDYAGNVSDAVTGSVKVDATAPTVGITGCPTSPVLLNSSQSINVTASDAGSGLVSDPTGQVSLDTSSLGQRTMTIPVSDKVGYTASASCIYSVAYGFSGFSSPVDNNGILNVAKAGSAIPLKWQLTDANGPVTNLSSLAVKVSVANFSCGLTETTDQVEEYAANASGLLNLGGGYYQFNWKSPTNYANSCKTLSLDLGEGKDANGVTITHTALFQFKK